MIHHNSLGLARDYSERLNKIRDARHVIGGKNLSIYVMVGTHRVKIGPRTMDDVLAKEEQVISEALRVLDIDPECNGAESDDRRRRLGPKLRIPEEPKTIGAHVDPDLAGDFDDLINDIANSDVGGETKRKRRFKKPQTPTDICDEGETEY